MTLQVRLSKLDGSTHVTKIDVLEAPQENGGAPATVHQHRLVARGDEVVLTLYKGRYAVIAEE